MKNNYIISAFIFFFFLLPFDTKAELIQPGYSIDVSQKLPLTEAGSYNFLFKNDKEHYYYFDVREKIYLDFSIEIKKEDKPIHIEVFDQVNGKKQNIKRYISGKSNLLILDVGIHHIKISSSLKKQQYKLLFSVLSVGDIENDKAGNNLQTAAQINIVKNSAFIVKDWLGAFDPFDYYKIQLDDPSILEIMGNGRYNGVLFELLNNQGNIIAKSYNIKDPYFDHYITSALKPGAYYLKLIGYKQTLYDFSIKTLPYVTPPKDKSGNKISMSRFLGDLSDNPLAVKEWLGGQDRIDYYSFVLPQDSFLKIEALAKNITLDIQLLKKDGTVIYQNKPYAKDLSINLEQGKYVLALSSYYGDTDYELWLHAKKLAAPKKDNVGNSKETAYRVEFEEKNEFDYSDWIGFRDKEDFYYLDLIRPAILNVDINNLAAEIFVEIIEGNGGHALISSKITESNKKLSVNLNRGGYYIRLLSQYNETPYNLKLAFDYINDLPLE